MDERGARGRAVGRRQADLARKRPSLHSLPATLKPPAVSPAFRYRPSACTEAVRVVREEKGGEGKRKGKVDGRAGARGRAVGRRQAGERSRRFRRGPLSASSHRSHTHANLPFLPTHSVSQSIKPGGSMPLPFINQAPPVASGARARSPPQPSRPIRQRRGNPLIKSNPHNPAAPPTGRQSINKEIEP